MRSTRRAVAAVVSATVLSVAAACSTVEETPSASTVEVFTWWAEAGEKAGLDALVARFGTGCPGQRFENGVVAGGAGITAKQVLAGRLRHGDPPDTFQVHAGAELLDHIDAAQVADLSGDFDIWGLRTALPEGLIETLTVNGRVWSVPAGVHRANVVWANETVLAGAGITTAPDDLAGFLRDLETLRRGGVESPLALGRDWTQLMLLEAVLISELGPDGFTGLFTGETPWDGAPVTRAIGDFGRLLSYSNPDRDSLDWPQAQRLLLDGKAGYQLMGDWATTDQLSFPFPGNGTAFQWLSDSFALTSAAANPDGARCWLRTVASPEGQHDFSARKGSIPARTDAPTSGFTDYQVTTAEDWRTGVPVPSCAHGSACPQPWQNAANAAVAAFSTSGDATSLQDALAAAAKQFIRQQ